MTFFSIHFLPVVRIRIRDPALFEPLIQIRDNFFPISDPTHILFSKSFVTISGLKILFQLTQILFMHLFKTCNNFQFCEIYGYKKGKTISLFFLSSCLFLFRTFDNNLSVELEHVEFLGVGVAGVRDHRHQGKPRK